MLPAQLRQRIETIYGQRGQSAFAREIGVNDRTVRKWLAGDRRIPRYVELWLDRGKNGGTHSFR